MNIKNKKISILKSNALILSVSVLGLLVFYQNCSKGGFTAASSTALASLSSQCSAKVQATNLQKVSNADGLNCLNQTNYSCELRNFSEIAANEVKPSQTCILVGDESFCVPTTIRNYDTSPARKMASIDENDFRSGGEYNRQEANCNYFDITIQSSLMQSSGEDTAAALADIVKQCNESQEQAKLVRNK
ncbi:MAG: hypothetical protein AABY53_03885 [Bdellovibrionota bacterium]